MARPIWTGSISFGLVNVPVKLFPATRSHRVAFHELEAGTGSRIRHRRVSEKSGREVPWEKIERGYEVSKGRFVVLSEEELKAAAPHKTGAIEIEQFVPLGDIDPVSWDQSYYLAPDGAAAAKSYQLLLRVMEKQDLVAVGRVVMRAKEHVVVIRPYRNILALATMYYADEVRSVSEIGDVPKKAALPARELTMAEQLVESLTAPWDPSRYEDTFSKRVTELARRKEKGQEIVVPEGPEEGGRVVDLMEALKASLAGKRGGRARSESHRKPAARSGRNRQQATGNRQRATGNARRHR